MNARQRRKEIRRRHMALPVGKEVRLWNLRYATAYSYRTGKSFRLYLSFILAAESAHIHRHTGGGAVDIMFDWGFSGESGPTLRIPLRYVKLLNPADRAPRPWWSELKRNAMRGK